jgi:hypothetical protein
MLATTDPERIKCQTLATFITLEPSEQNCPIELTFPSSCRLKSIRVLPSKHTLERGEDQYHSQTCKLDSKSKSSLTVYAFTPADSRLLEQVELRDLSQNYFISPYEEHVP